MTKLKRSLTAIALLAALFATHTSQAMGPRRPVLPPPPPPPSQTTSCQINIQADCHGWEPQSTWFKDNTPANRDLLSCLHRAQDYYQWCNLDRPRDVVFSAFKLGDRVIATQSAHLPPSIWTSTSPTVDPTRLPLGTGHYLTSRPTGPGYVWACDPRAFQFPKVFGNTVGGDWIHATSFDITGKPVVHGQVFHPGVFSIRLQGNQRVFRGNGLPVGVPTGEFPTKPSDPAYFYDKNPTGLVAQTIEFALPANPQLAASPSCTGLEIGITLDGVELSGPLDSSGRDEMAYELMDLCDGMTQPGGLYHRHALSNCIPHIHERNALVGYALDGFGIYSPYDASGRELTSQDLDECHGTTSVVPWDGRLVRMYHYVLTRDFPYSPGCFKGTPIANPFPALPPPQF